MQKTLKIRVTSDACLNLTDNEESLPVLLRVYQLSNETEFMQASFEHLWKQDKKALENSFQSRHEYTIYPNKVERFSFHQQAEARYIGLFATFRKPSRETWRQIVKIPPGFKPRSINVDLKNNELK